MNASLIQYIYIYIYSFLDLHTVVDGLQLKKSMVTNFDDIAIFTISEYYKEYFLTQESHCFETFGGVDNDVMGFTMWTN